MSGQLVALYLVVFDQKVGYNITWQRQTHDGIDLAGVEFKSLPSGSHNTPSDTVYFAHGDHAGVNAFAQTVADAEHRNARFAAVGALVQSKYDALGLAWQYAGPLGELAQTVVEEPEDYRPLEEYWKHADVATTLETIEDVVQHPTTPLGTVLEMDLHQEHPARSLVDTVERFGPLLFPLQRQALLGRRILILGHSPVQGSCHLVHNLSLLSQLSTDPQRDYMPANRSQRPLYSVGIADMSTLQDRPAWIACTTDAILRDKKQLYDVLVEMPSRSDTAGRLAIKDADGKAIQATQRDVQRFNALHYHLWSLDRQADPELDYKDDPGSTDDRVALLDASNNLDLRGYVQPDVSLDVIEPYSWTNLAQRSLSWWAGPSDQETVESEEPDLDQELLQDLPGTTFGSGSNIPYDRTASHAVNVVAYFQETSKLITDTAVQSVSSGRTTEGSEMLEIPVSTLQRAGLDSWSQNDQRMFADLVRKLSGREAKIMEESITLCGIRVC